VRVLPDGRSKKASSVNAVRSACEPSSATRTTRGTRDRTLAPHPPRALRDAAAADHLRGGGAPDRESPEGAGLDGSGRHALRADARIRARLQSALALEIGISTSTAARCTSGV
jgi:hypothetical protein